MISVHKMWFTSFFFTILPLTFCFLAVGERVMKRSKGPQSESDKGNWETAFSINPSLVFCSSAVPLQHPPCQWRLWERLSW